MTRHVVAETTVELSDSELVRVTEIAVDGGRMALLTVVMQGGEAEAELDAEAAVRLMKALGPVAGVSV